MACRRRSSLCEEGHGRPVLSELQEPCSLVHNDDRRRLLSTSSPGGGNAWRRRRHRRRRRHLPAEAYAEPDGDLENGVEQAWGSWW